MAKHITVEKDGKQIQVVLLEDHKAELTRQVEDAKELTAKTAIDTFKATDEYKEIISKNIEYKTNINKNKFIDNVVVKKFNEKGLIGERFLQTQIDWTSDEKTIKSNLEKLSKEYFPDEPDNAVIPTPNQNNPVKGQNNEPDGDLLVFNGK